MKPNAPSQTDVASANSHVYDVGDLNGDGIAEQVSVPDSVVKQIEDFSSNPQDDYLKISTLNK